MAEKRQDKDHSSAPHSNATRGQKPKPASLASLMSETGHEKVDILMRNMNAAMMEGQALLGEVAKPSMSLADIGQKPQDPFGIAELWSRVGSQLARNPNHMMDAQCRLMQGHLDLWRSMMFPGDADQEPSRDRRFSDPEWSDNPFFKLLHRSYELNTKWLMSLVENAEDLSEADRRKANFFARQTADAFAPTNFFSTNPQALRALLESGGESVLNGIRQAREDIKRGGGKLMISQTDDQSFKVGQNVATAEGYVVFRNELIEILKFDAVTEEVYAKPLLIFPPWINKYYILDLREQNSMIRWLREQGISVYVVSWKSADHSIAHFTWDDYVQQGAYAAVEAVCAHANSKKVNTVGYCIGGTMLSSALAHMSIKGDKRVASATYFASQADFSEAGDLLVFTDQHAISHIETMIDANDGIMAGEDMTETFNYLRPVDLVWRYVVDNYMLGKKPSAFDLLYWNGDQTNIPGPTHLTYLQDLYRDNALSEGRFKVLGETVNLGDIEIPTFFQASRDDHIAPYKSIYKAACKFGGKTRFVMAGSGHIAGVINHPDAKKYQHWVNKDLPNSADQWTANAEERPGSWWPYWFKWLKKKSGKKIAAPKPADIGLGSAPGTYVLARLEDIGIRRKA